MSKAGQYNYKGINAQSWAAMSLFLQNLRDPKFSSIQLEAENFEDFNLIFENGKKIICESKDRQKKFSYPDLKELLKKVNNKGVLGDKDEILVVCSNANSELISNIENIKFFEQLQNEFIQKGYESELLPMLSKVQFWVVPSSFNADVIYSLFSELLNFWLPPEEIQRFVDNILIQKIYKGSADGKTYSSKDILKEIDDFKQEIQKDSDYFNIRVQKEKQFKELEKIVNSKGKVTWGNRSISTFSIRWDLMSFAMDRLKKRTDLDLEKWDELWQLNQVYYFTFRIFNVFENNLQSEKNRKYILSYIKKHTKSIRGFYYPDYFDVDVVKIVTKIIEGDCGLKYLKEAFIIVKDLITFNENEFFYLKDFDYNHREWEKGVICKLLHKIYKHANETLKQEVFNLLISSFNIIKDDGEFSHYTPEEVFKILHEWLNENFKMRFSTIVNLICEQYQRYYKKFGSKLEFKGWEHSGGGTSFGPGGHHISDRHFIGFTIAPAIQNYYNTNKNEGWEFIKQHCINSTSKVSKARPDFLNRAVYEIVLNRYAKVDKKVSNEAFTILKEFILSRKGIPHKADLIFQTVAGSSLSDDKKWKLVELTVKKYGIPINPFAEKIVADIAKKGYKPAKATLKSWFSDPKYHTRFFSDLDSVSSIDALLDSDLNFATELFKALITSEYINNFSAYTVAALLYEIIKKNYAIGLSILRILENEDQLSESQQIIYSFSLFNHHGNDDSDDQELLLKIYKEVVDPFLKKHDEDINKICERLTLANCREAFVQFASRLVAKKRIADALRIIRIFVNDPNPYLPGEDPRDPENKYNENKKIENGEEPHSITSVRGWCGWVLMKCSNLDGRDQIPKIIELVKNLINDQNYYVIHMACLALGQIARNRLTVLPSNRNILFFNDDQKTALQMSKKVESIAFNLLEKFITWSSLVQKSMIKSIMDVFNHIKALNEKDSFKLVKILSKLPSETIDEAASLLIFFAEFRKDAYKNWQFGMPGLYDDLKPEKYDDNKFKAILINIIKELQKNNPEHSFKFTVSFEHLMREVPVGEIDKNTKIAFEYLDLLSNNYAHNVFNLIYKILETKFNTPDNYIERWYSLLIKCLKVEKGFYDEQVKKDDIKNCYWYPTRYHSRILEFTYEKLGKDKFMQAAKIIFSFPKGIELRETDNLVSIIQQLAKTDKDAKTIVKTLFDKNPSKYWSLINTTEKNNN